MPPFPASRGSEPQIAPSQRHHFVFRNIGRIADVERHPQVYRDDRRELRTEEPAMKIGILIPRNQRSRYGLWMIGALLVFLAAACGGDFNGPTETP